MATDAPAPPPRRRFGAGRVLLLVVGVVGVLLGILLLAGGGFVLWADTTERDDDGYLSTPHEPLATATYALTTESLDVNTGSADWAVDTDAFGSVKIDARSTNGRALFVGIGPSRAVDAYLRGVSHAELDDVDVRPFSVTYRNRAGGPPRAEPAAQRFWVARASGSPNETVRWDVRSGDWAVVVMNADASRGVAVEAAVGAKLGFVRWVAVGLLIAGAVFTVGGALLVYLALRKPAAA